MSLKTCGLLLLLTFSLSLPSVAQTKPQPRSKDGHATAPRQLRAAAPDLSKQPTLYVVGYAHLDTEWRWEYPQVVREYLSKTLRSNFDLFEKYPDYVFNFSGSNRYLLMKEYYPEDFAKLKKYVAEGKWFPAGSSVEEGDVNSPSAESLFRQFLYGNEFFRREFGVASAEYMLPDCFGFPASLPSLLAHAGIKGFSTQKLTWGSSALVGGPNSPERTPEGTPFDVGVWEGPDGHSVLAALNPGGYGSDIETDLSKPLPPIPDSMKPKDMTAEEFQAAVYQHNWAARVEHNGEVSGLFADYHYYGTGDIGGAPSEHSVKILEDILHKREAALPVLQFQRDEGPPPTAAPVRVGEGPVHVVSSRADQLFLDVTPSEYARLPKYKGELELTNHSAGSLTSEAYQKRWNRENEVLGQDAEETSLAAMWLGARPYPLERLNTAWNQVLAGQFHDIMAGTATPKSYTYAWNDDVIALNQFAGVIKSAASSVASAMNTEGPGVAVMVFNPLNIARQDIVEADIHFPEGTPQGVRVTGPDGRELPAQINGEHEGAAHVMFLASAPSVGFAVYHIEPAQAATSSELKVSEKGLENARYRVKIDQNGDVSSIFDKQLDKELLSSPIRLAFQTEHPHDWPAWNMDWEDEHAQPRGYVTGPAKISVVENGPARVGVQISREAEGSKFVQIIRLSAGTAGDRVEFSNDIDWHTKVAALKSVFPLTATNTNATYNWDVGTIERPTMNEKKFEVPSHQWFDLTDQGGGFGVTILSGDKYGSDKFDDHTLRLTLIYTPGLGGGIEYPDQTTQDFGRHHFVYGLASHADDWRKAGSEWQGWRLNQPMLAFTTPKHQGTLGQEFSLLKIDNPNIRVLALKKAEHSDEMVVRMVELNGAPERNVRLTFASPVVEARELNAQEQPLGVAKLEGGALVADFTPYGLHTFALRLSPAAHKSLSPQSVPVRLSYDVSAATRVGKPAEGCFDCNLDEPDAPQGDALPAELLPSELDYNGIHFSLGAAGNGRPDAVIPRGQKIELPAGNYNRLYILAAAIRGDHEATFEVGSTPVKLKIEEWTGYIGQWWDRRFETKLVPVKVRPGSPPEAPGEPQRMHRSLEFTGQIDPGYIKRADLAWFSTDRRDAGGNHQPYSYSYLFAYGVDLPPGAKTLTLPKDPNIRVLAVSVAQEPTGTAPAHPLYDTLGADEPHPSIIVKEEE